MTETSKQEWVLISKNEPLNPGDRVRMYYDVIGPTYLVAAQIAAIEKKLESDPRFKLIASSLPKGDGWVKDIWFEILILKPEKSTSTSVQQAGISGLVIGTVLAAAFAITSVFIWLSFREIRKMNIGPEAVKEVIKETGWTAMKIAAAAIIGVVALKWWKK